MRILAIIFATVGIGLALEPCTTNLGCMDCVRVSCYYYETTAGDFCAKASEVMPGRVLMRIKKSRNCQEQGTKYLLWIIAYLL